MSTIQFKCDSCGTVYLGDTSRNFVDSHLITKGEKDGIRQTKFISKYYICDNCIKNDRKKYMEV